MAKGDDAIARRRGKKLRKRLRRGEESVSARVASLIAAKRRRKAGTRRICEGMCFSAPTPEDPFNERYDKNNKQPQPAPKADKGKSKKKNKAKKPQKKRTSENNSREVVQPGGEVEQSSKFLALCLNAIREAWSVEGEDCAEGPESIGSWGAELWRCLSGKSNVLDTSGDFATRQQVAWVVSAAADVIAQKEKAGSTVDCPFLLYLVPSQERASEVRSICKPLKALGIHSVSIHSGVSTDHQVNGLKACEPEFLISTPERLVELLSLKVTDISSVSYLVIDGLRSFTDTSDDVLTSILSAIPCKPRVIMFCGLCDERTSTLAQKLLGNLLTRLSLNDSVASQGQFISQNVHFCQSSEHKMSEVKETLLQILGNTNSPSRSILLLAGGPDRVKTVASCLRHESYIVSGDSENTFYAISTRAEATKLLVKDLGSIWSADLGNIERILILDLSQIKEHVDVISRMARHSVLGMVHVFLTEEDASVIEPLVGVLRQCGQRVPEVLERSAPSAQNGCSPWLD